MLDDNVEGMAGMQQGAGCSLESRGRGRPDWKKGDHSSQGVAGANL